MVAADKIKGQMIALTPDLPTIETPYSITSYGSSQAACPDEFDALMSSVRWYNELTTRLDALDNVLKKAEGLDVETARTLRGQAVSFAETIEEQLEIIGAEWRFQFRNDPISDRLVDRSMWLPAEVRRSKVRINQLHLHFRKVYIAGTERVGRFRRQLGKPASLGNR